jgi:tetratricopeptide (TPR) repeat protein
VGQDADRITQAWLDLSPASAFALVTRAKVLEKRGWTARGSAFAKATAPEKFAEMSLHFAEAVPLYRRALEIDPELTDAHIGLVSIAASGTGGDDEVALVDQARRVAPGCAEVAMEFMWALQPKWGGSFGAMLAYAKVLEPEVSASPLMASQLVAPYAVVINEEQSSDAYTAEAAQAIDEMLPVSSNEELLHLAAEANFKRSDGSAIDRGKGAAYALQRQRFKPMSAWLARRTGQFLMVQEPEWALAVLIGAIASDPRSGHGHYYFAAASNNARLFDQAERHYLLAIDTPEVAADALVELAWMLMVRAGLPHEDAMRRARPHRDELLRRYPDDALEEMFALVEDGERDGHVAHERLEAWLRIADPADPLQKEVMADVEAMLGR